MPTAGMTGMRGGEMGCKHLKRWAEWVPYGSGNVPMPMVECGRKDIEAADLCGPDCPGYEEEEDLLDYCKPGPPSEFYD